MSESFEQLVGHTILKASGKEGDYEIKFELENGHTYIMEHDQDCCEHVYIKEIDGDLQDVVGSPILLAEEVSQDAAGSEEVYGSGTWTFYKIRTMLGSVTISWLGTSNGYYAEGVSFRDVDRNRFDYLYGGMSTLLSDEQNKIEEEKYKKMQAENERRRNEIADANIKKLQEEKKKLDEEKAAKLAKQEAEIAAWNKKVVEDTERARAKELEEKAKAIISTFFNVVEKQSYTLVVVQGYYNILFNGKVHNTYLSELEFSHDGAERIINSIILAFK